MGPPHGGLELEECTLDLATLVKLVGTLIILATAIVLGGSVGAFADTASFVLVIGGTLLVDVPDRQRRRNSDR